MISKAFIVRRYPYLDERWVKDLFPNEAVTIHVFDRQNGGSMYQLRVMAIPANHCPGSVMYVSADVLKLFAMMPCNESLLD